MMMNRLSTETSPYLLQHQHNPVHWYPWAEEAFEAARRENKPVLVSIGYSSCHWCHVMEKESFENEKTAGVMNELFINIKVDREEYPDVDHLYMDAVQAMTGSGGWPLNVFLTDEKKPFYGGTYFPPKPIHGRASWVDVLQSVSSFYHHHRDEVEVQGDRLLQHLFQPLKVKGTAETDGFKAEKIIQKLWSTADTIHGGFGAAPKFPSTHILQFFLLNHMISGNEDLLKHVLLSLDNMSAGGMYDVIGGGFSRYSTDTQWHIPHFEKMLYDNALLLELYSKAYHLTGRTHYKQICEETIQWLQKEMTSKEGGFYSALDADSEGVEGKFYTWTASELKSLLKEDYDTFSHYFSVTEEGNWEHRNILYTEEGRGMVDSEKLKEWKQHLYQIRSKRIWPLLDDKILLSWNSLMAKALMQCYLYTQHQEALHMAEKNMNFLWDNFRREEGGYYHTYKNGARKIHAYADDLAYWMDALIEYGHVSGNTLHYHRAGDIMTYLMEYFSNEETGLFNFSHGLHKQVAHSKPEMYDGATPSSNAIILRCLKKLYPIFLNSMWEEMAEAMMQFIRPMAENYPSSFGIWLEEMVQHSQEATEICIIGKDAPEIYASILRKSGKNRPLFMVSEHLDETLAGHSGKKNSGIYVCKNQRCFPPVQSLEEAINQLNQRE